MGRTVTGESVRVLPKSDLAGRTGNRFISHITWGTPCLWLDLKTFCQFYNSLSQGVGSDAVAWPRERLQRLFLESSESGIVLLPLHMMLSGQADHAVLVSVFQGNYRSLYPYAGYKVSMHTCIYIYTHHSWTHLCSAYKITVCFRSVL